MRFVIIVFITLFLAACESSPPAPVIERVPQPSKPSSSNKPSSSSKAGSPAKSADSKTAAGKDWRPDSYTVKKGDTLYSIGLEYGYDYKEIAAANNITVPYTIKIGQILSFGSLNGKPAPAETKPSATENSDGVIVTPIKTDTGSTPTVAEAKTTPSAVTPVLSEPKAIREPYSIEAMNRKPEQTNPSTANPADTKPTDTKPANSTNTASSSDDALIWIWPTEGKVIGNFNESSNKGIDIAGNAGQSINAASGGKVIYTGSDLRGYGKLVIIKHSKTFLSVYAHNSKIIAKEGQTVVSGQKIAEMGNTDTDSVKLHFEIRSQGKSVDPVKYLPQN